MADAPFIPYCGIPPVPHEVAWNLDPVLIGALLVVCALYGVGLRRLGPDAPGRFEQVAFLAGWLALATALISPLCNLSVALFSARVAQHMIIILISAPLLAFGRAAEVITGAILPERMRLRGVGRLELLAAPALFAIALWMWHAPGPYDATLQDNAVYWLMQTMLIATSVALWRALLADLALTLGLGLLASFATGLQMSLLGFLLTFSPRPWFAVHATTTQPWGLTTLDDQQLGGLIMWVPGGGLLTLYALVLFGLGITRTRPTTPILNSDRAAA